MEMKTEIKRVPQTPIEIEPKIKNSSPKLRHK
jgi:hypothetical protein